MPDPNVFDPAGAAIGALPAKSAKNTRHGQIACNVPGFGPRARPTSPKPAEQDHHGEEEQARLG
jgi:hypothetical protein